MESPQKNHTADELPRICKILLKVHKRLRRKSLPDAAADEQQRKKFEFIERAQEAFENIKRELSGASVLGMPTEKGMYILDTDASVVATLGTFHQEQEWT